MKRLGIVLSLLLSHTLHAEKKIVAYVPNWVDTRAFAQKIDYHKLTHINIAFENPTNSVGDLSFNSKNEILISTAHSNKVQVLISIGGGAASSNMILQERYFDLLTDAKRSGFASRMVDYVVAHHFDGLDVDIEGPSINKEYGALIADLSIALKAKGKLLTAAVSKGYGGAKVPNSVFDQFDFVNIMAYDGAGYWSPNSPGQHSSIEFARSNTQYWLDRGLPKAKAILGVPFYGYGFGEAFRKGDYSYANILAKYPGAENKDEVGDKIWYNGMPTIKAKSEYVMNEGLGGMMIWSLDYDVPGDKSLLSTMHKVLNQEPVK